MTVAIVADTCHYLPASSSAAENDIHEVSLYVHWPAGAQRESEIVDYDAYYRRLARQSRAADHLAAVDRRLLAVYEPLLEAGNEIVSIHLAGGMSGTVGAAEQAREQLGRARPAASTCWTRRPPAAARGW